MTRLAFAVLAALAATAGDAGADPIDDALARARREDKVVVIEFRADWCRPCRVFERFVLTRRDVQAELRQRIFVPIDVDAPAGEEAARRYRINFIPTFLSLDPSGEVLQRSTGIGDVMSPWAFIAFFERAEIWRAYRRRESDPRITRFAALEAARARRSPGTGHGGWSLARAAIAGRLDPTAGFDLFALHASATTSERQLAFTVFAALAAGAPSEAAAVADTLLDLDPLDSAALAAAAHAYMASGRERDAYRIAQRCRDGARARREQVACRTVEMRLLFGREPVAIELLRHAVHLRVLAALAAGGAVPVANAPLADPLAADPLAADPLAADPLAAERAAWDAIWGILPDPVAEARARAWIPPGSLWRQRGLIGSLLGFRADGGLSGEGRFQLDGRALFALRPGPELKPMALTSAALGIDFADELVYDASAQLGFAAAGGLIGIYTGIAASDHGAGDDGALGVPIELALFYPGRRFGVEGFVRTSILFAGDQARRTGSNDAPLGADELSLGLSARIPGLDAPLLVGIRHDQLFDRTLTGLWLGIQLRP